MPRSSIIVGGGPAGALLAYILASRGAPVTLIERQTDFTREFRGEGLAPSGQLMFKEAGLWDAFESVPQVEFETAWLYFKRRKFLDMEFSALPDSMRWVSQPAMLEMLIEKASAFEGFTFRRGERVVGPVMRDGRVVGVELSGHENHERLEADYVFACDGRFSALRKAAELEQARTPEFFDIVWCKIPKPQEDLSGPPLGRGYLGNGHLGLFIPTYENLLQIGWVIRKGAYKEFKEMGIERWMEEMARHVSDDMAAHLRAHAKDAIHPVLLDVMCDCFSRWSVPGMTLVGDAAHPMSPVGAQGINIALRDAVVAANHFVPVLTGDGTPDGLDAAAASFRAERIGEVEHIQSLQRWFPQVGFRWPIVLDLIMPCLRLLLALGIAQWFAGRTDIRSVPFLYGTTEVKLTV